MEVKCRQAVNSENQQKKKRREKEGGEPYSWRGIKWGTETYYVGWGVDSQIEPG